jgi:MFS family permease
MRASSVFLLFLGTLVTAAGYGATFLLTQHFRALGGSEIETGRTLGGAMIGTFVGVPLVGWLGQWVGGARLAALGALSVAAGYAVLAALTVLSPVIMMAGFLIGFGWGAFYLAAPMAVSERVTDTERGYWFTNLAAVQMAGIGGSPLVASSLASTLHHSTAWVFHVLAIACVGAGVLLWRFEKVAPRRLATASPAVVKTTGLLLSLAAISRTRALYPVLMVCLGACVFTGMMTFQSSLVRASGLDANVFFTTYAVVVVGARFTLASVLNRARSDSLAVVLLLLMTGGVLAMFAVSLGVVAQVLSATLLALGYGLVYPVIQTQVVNDSPEMYRRGALTWFVIAYFIGIFGFPVLGGWLIVNAGTERFLAVVLACAVAELVLSIVRRTS